jgi:hypothetical protein
VCVCYWFDLPPLPSSHSSDTAFNVTAVTLGNSSTVADGDPILIIGNNEGYVFSAIEGTVSDVRVLSDTPGTRPSIDIETTTDSGGGSSGSPVWNAEGEREESEREGGERGGWVCFSHPCALTPPPPPPPPSPPSPPRPRRRRQLRGRLHVRPRRPHQLRNQHPDPAAGRHPRRARRRRPDRHPHPHGRRCAPLQAAQGRGRRRHRGAGPDRGRAQSHSRVVAQPQGARGRRHQAGRHPVRG